MRLHVPQGVPGAVGDKKRDDGPSALHGAGGGVGAAFEEDAGAWDPETAALQGGSATFQVRAILACVREHAGVGACKHVRELGGKGGGEVSVLCFWKQLFDGGSTC